MAAPNARLRSAAMEHLDIELARQLLAGQLPPAQRAHWQRHAEACERCRALLANERALLGVLGVGDPPPAPAAPANLGRVLERVSDVLPGGRARRRMRTVFTVAAAGAALGLTILLAHQLRPPPDDTLALARALHITPDLQGAVVDQLDELATLAAEPWLADEYEAVEALETLIRGEPQP